MQISFYRLSFCFLATALTVYAQDIAPPMTESRKENVVPLPATPVKGDADGAEAGGEAGEAKGATVLPRAIVSTRPELTHDQTAKWAEALRKTYQTPADKWPAPNVDSTVKWEELGLLPQTAYNRLAFKDGDVELRARVDLGKLLFSDPRISGSGQLACASCHEAELGWSDGRATSFGHSRKELARNAPTLLNIGLSKEIFWDGRAKDLEDQARQVLMNESEMKSSPETVVKLSAIPEYRKKFADVFGDEEITFERVAEMLAEFERSIVGGRSRFDVFLKGRPEVLSDDAVIGLHLFRTQAGCMNCHNGPNFTDNQFHNLGLTYYGRKKYEDFGRYKVTKVPADMGKFKTPTLRNVERTRPYMHNGLFELQGVLNMYNAGMPTIRRKPEQEHDPLFPQKSHLLKPLNLNRQEMNFIIAFLEALTEPPTRVRVELPPDPPETVKIESLPTLEKSE